jgi:hypothetical protein
MASRQVSNPLAMGKVLLTIISMYCMMGGNCQALQDRKIIKTDCILTNMNYTEFGISYCTILVILCVAKGALDFSAFIRTQSVIQFIGK